MWRVAVAYAVAGWLLVQIATQVFPIFHMPDWTAQIVVVLVVLGFPVAVVFAWVYEITPEGVRRTEPADSPGARPQNQSQEIGRKLNTVIVAVLIVAVALMGWRLLALRHAASAPATKAASASVQAPRTPALSAAVTPEKTIAAAPTPPAALPKPFNPPAGTLAVLPFQNLSNDQSQRYFSDGITEELTNALGQNTALTVIAWDTASRYRNSGESPAAIGAALNVATLLNGSIEREGDTVRVIAELVDTRSGKQLWSAHYDDSLANVFQVQDRISAAIAGALKLKLASVAPAPTVNPQAHDLVLQARALMEKAQRAAPIEQARALLEQAIALDPGYADAHAWLARALNDLTQFSTLSLKNALPKVREEAHKALQLEPDNVDAILALAGADLLEGRNVEARKGFQRAIELDPSNAAAHVDYGNVLPLQQSLAQEQEAVELDPNNAVAQINLADDYLDTGNYPQALPPLLALMKLAPHSADNAMGLALTYSLRHRPEDAVKAFDLAQPDAPLAKALVAAGRLTYQSVLDPGLHAQAQSAVDALRGRSDLDPHSMADVIQLDLVLERNGTALELLPQTCAAAPVNCSDLSVNPVYLPLHGQPAFEALVKKYDTVSLAPASASSSP